MAYGQCTAHRGIDTTTYSREDDFAQFCQRQQTRVIGLAYRGHRRFVDRLLKLAAREAFEDIVTVRGFGQGGGRTNYGEPAE